MELSNSDILAENLDVVEHDLLLLNVSALGCESLGNLSVANRAIDLALLRCLHGKLESTSSLHCLSKSLGISLDLGHLLRLLLLLLSELLQGRLSSENGLLLWEKEVAGIAVLNLYNVVLITKVLDVLNHNNLHNQSKIVLG